jgi:hypothetical protein
VLGRGQEAHLTRLGAFLIQDQGTRHLPNNSDDGSFTHTVIPLSQMHNIVAAAGKSRGCASSDPPLAVVLM